MMLADAGDAFGQTVISGSLLLAIPVALIAGLVSFASPCVLPLVPAYVGYLGGMTGSAQTRVLRGRHARQDGPARSRVLLGVALFVAGFTAVFVALAVLAGSLGGLLVEYQDTITRVLGVVVIVLGLGFLGLIPFLQNEKRGAPRAARRAVGRAAARASRSGSAGCRASARRSRRSSRSRSTAARPAAARCSAVAFCLGLGLPFLLVALVRRPQRRRARLPAPAPAPIMRFGGAMLVILGLALVTGVWGTWSSWLQGVLVGGDPFVPVV